MNKFIYNIKHIMQSKTILALLAVVGMIGTVTNVVVASAAPNVKQNVKTRKVKLYSGSEFDEKHYKGTVDIPVDATNIDAALIIVNSSYDDDKNDEYLRVPVIEGRKLAFTMVTDNNTKKKSYVCSFEKYDEEGDKVIDRKFHDQKFESSGVSINKWTIRKLDRPHKVNLYNYYYQGKKNDLIVGRPEGTVDIPVGATNLEAALIIVNSTPQVSEYLRRPLIGGRELQCTVVTDKNTKKKSYVFSFPKYGPFYDYDLNGDHEVDDEEFNNQIFEPRDVYVNTDRILKLRNI